jgi:hypothetical protein
MRSATYIDGPVTVAFVIADPGSVADGLIGFGQARCRPGDHFDEQIGVEIATGRATAQLGELMAERAANRSITQAAYDAEVLDVDVVLPNGQTLFHREMPRIAAEELAHFCAEVLGARIDEGVA